MAFLDSLLYKLSYTSIINYTNNNKWVPATSMLVIQCCGVYSFSMKPFHLLLVTHTTYYRRGLF